MDFFKKNMIAIFAALAIGALFLPLLSVSTSVESEFAAAAATSSRSVSGFSAVTQGIFGYLLLIGPALLIAMNYIKQLDKYKGLLAVAVPAGCLVVLVIVYMQAKDAAGAANVDSAFVSSTAEVSMGFGLFLTAIAHVATAVAGAVTYHGLKLDKTLLDQIKNGSTELLENVKSGGAELLDSAKQAAQNVKSDSSAVPAAGSAPAAKKSRNIQRTDEILALIRKLAAMKDEGILTEEEFAAQKSQLLSELE